MVKDYLNIGLINIEEIIINVVDWVVLFLCVICILVFISGRKILIISVM